MNILEIVKWGILHQIPKELAHSIIYYQRHGALWNRNNPKTYDEKIHWHIVNTYGNQYACYADKYLVRKYVKECGLEKYLITLLGVYEKPEQIDYSKLPNEFILKTNHASGPDFYCICRGKEQIDVKEVNHKFKMALKKDFSFKTCEYHYHTIHPLIMCEKLLERKDGTCLTDYKVVCHYGKPECILVCTNRDEGRDYYSTNWEYLDYVKEEYRSRERTSKPKVLPEMLNAAAILSKPFPIARIDFYVVNDKLYFGEITLTPSGGNHQNLNDKGQKELGSFIPIFKSNKK